VQRATFASPPAATGESLSDKQTRLSHLRALALSGLPRMYDPAGGRFVFRLRRTDAGIVPEGGSDRYTAITLLGLSGEAPAAARAALHGSEPLEVWRSLAARAARSPILGDVALTLWAGVALGAPRREDLVVRLLELRPAQAVHPTVEVAWTLSALTLDPEAPVGDVREQVARRLRESQGARSGAFPHVLGGGGGLRAHVCCFADLVYPIQALSLRAEHHEDRAAAEAARRAAELIVGRQGRDGQWWWHYDVRSGEVVEGYPVYAVHQDAMAPMALIAAGKATRIDFSGAVHLGLDWLEHSPELGGRSLIDEGAGLIWRKVARREPGKLSRSLQAVASRLHRSLRVPGLDLALPAKTIDYEDRPYHLGWLLHAFPAEHDGAR
jgi:hypothetical protein